MQKQWNKENFYWSENIFSSLSSVSYPNCLLDNSFFTCHGLLKDGLLSWQGFWGFTALSIHFCVNCLQTSCSYFLQRRVLPDTSITFIFKLISYSRQKKRGILFLRLMDCTMFLYFILNLIYVIWFIQEHWLSWESFEMEISFWKASLKKSGGKKEKSKMFPLLRKFAILHEVACINQWLFSVSCKNDVKNYMLWT